MDLVVMFLIFKLDYFVLIFCGVLKIKLESTQCKGNYVSEKIFCGNKTYFDFFFLGDNKIELLKRLNINETLNFENYALINKYVVVSSRRVMR